MKKNLKLLFATVLSVAALVGCEHTSAETSTAQPSATQDSSTTSSTAATSTPAASSSSSSSKASSSSKVDTGVYYEPYEFNVALANYEVTIRTSSTTLDLYGTDACYISSSSDSYGYMKIDSKKSVWEYELDDQNQVFLTDCLYGSVDDTVDLSTLMTYYSAIDILAEDTSGDNWVEARKAHTYTTTDADTISAMLVLAGVSSSSSPATATSLTLTSVKDGTLKLTGTATITTSSYFGSSTSTEAVNVIFSNFGENENAAITSFLANPVIPAYTDFDSELKTAMTTYSGAALPFDSKFTAYSGYSVSSSSGYYQYQDMKCGNLLSEYSTLLTQAGFTKETSDDEDSTDSNSATFYKVKSAASDISAESNYVVQIAYMSKEDVVSQYQSSIYGSLYQDGVFIIMGYVEEGTLSFDNITSINKFFSKIFLKADNTALLPQMNITPAEIAFADGTAYYNQYSSYFGTTFKGAYMIKGSFDVANDALTAMQTYETALTTAGYSLSTSSTATYAALSATNHSTSYLYSDATYEVVVSIKLGEVSSSSSSSGDATALDDGDSSTTDPDETVAALDGSFSVTIFVC